MTREKQLFGRLITRNINVLKKIQGAAFMKEIFRVHSERANGKNALLSKKKRERERETVNELGQVKGGETGA